MNRPATWEERAVLAETALSESRAENDNQKQLAAHWQNMAAMHKAERDEALLRTEGAERWNGIYIAEITQLKAECERLLYTNKILAERSFELQTNLTAVLEGRNNGHR